MNRLDRQISNYLKGYMVDCYRWGSEMNVREPEDAMAFGRQGYGAPVRTKSGRLR
mgnify:CR=1 FL=1